MSSLPSYHTSYIRFAQFLCKIEPNKMKAIDNFEQLKELYMGVPSFAKKGLENNKDFIDFCIANMENFYGVKINDVLEEQVFLNNTGETIEKGTVVQKIEAQNEPETKEIKAVNTKDPEDYIPADWEPEEAQREPIQMSLF